MKDVNTGHPVKMELNVCTIILQVNAGKCKLSSFDLVYFFNKLSFFFLLERIQTVNLETNAFLFIHHLIIHSRIQDSQIHEQRQLHADIFQIVLISIVLFYIQK